MTTKNDKTCYQCQTRHPEDWRKLCHSGCFWKKGNYGNTDPIEPYLEIQQWSEIVYALHTKIGQITDGQYGMGTDEHSDDQSWVEDLQEILETITDELKDNGAIV